jgi:hypothetical protein
LKSSSITKQLTQALPPRSRLWTPNNLKAVITWLAPRRLFRLGLGTGFSKWRDAKGNTQFVQTDASKQPSITQSKIDFKGLLVPEFDGTNDFLADETPTDRLDIGDGDFYIMAAIKTGIVAPSSIVCLQREDNTEQINFGIFSGKTGGVLRLQTSGFSFVSGGTNLTNNTTYLVYCERINGIIHVYLDGTKDSRLGLVNSTSIDNNAASVWGARDTTPAALFDGKIAEVVIGGSTRKNIIGVKQRQLLEGYMAHNCGIASVLPDSHPYKKGPPRV